MNFKTLASGVSANGAQTAVNLTRELGRTQTGVVQVDGLGTANVAIQGRLDSSLDWVTIVTFTADDAKAVTIFPEMRSNITGYDSGTITVKLGA